jgi:arabinan endo-1,5-alpha-L-arabinosidase
VCAHVLPDGLPPWARAAVPSAGNVWAPDVSFWGGLWHCYWAASEFGTLVSVIGESTTPTLDPTDPAFGWTDAGLVLATNHTSAYNAIDPSYVEGPDGAPHLVFGSFWSGIQVVALDAGTGKPAAGGAVTNIASRESSDKAIEGAFMVRNGTAADYWLFASWEFCCRGAQSNYEVRVGHSAAGPAGPFVDRAGVPMLAGGGTHFIGGGNGWAAGGGQSLLRGAMQGGGGGAIAGPTTMVLHAYDGKTGDPYLQVVGVDWSGAWPVPVTKAGKVGGAA